MVAQRPRFDVRGGENYEEFPNTFFVSLAVITSHPCSVVYHSALFPFKQAVQTDEKPYYVYGASGGGVRAFNRDPVGVRYQLPSTQRTERDHFAR